MIKNTQLAAELLRADEQYLISLSNKGLYKRALKDAEGADLGYSEGGDGISLKIGDESCIIRAPLAGSECSCAARGVCRHILAAAILLKGEADPSAAAEISAPVKSEQKAPEQTEKQEPQEQKPQDDKPLSKKDIERVRETADICRAQMAGILKRGLVRAAESADDGFEIAAVRCHAAKMADAERAVRELGSRLGDCLERRAAFDEKQFTQRLCECERHFEGYFSDELTQKELGSFKKSYTDYEGTLVLLPVGVRNVTEGDYTGSVYYFLDLDESKENRFLCYADLRPVFYENMNRVRFGSSEVWGAGVTIRSLMRSQLTLIGAKTSGGHLSSSSQTTIVSQTRANLNCRPFRKMVYNDLDEIALALAKRDAADETQRLFLFHPKELLGFEFDKVTQQLEAQLSDGRNAVRMSAKYTANTKEFIEQTEAHLKKMKSASDVYYVWLVSAYFEDGELVLYPIEMYNFITPLEERHFTLPKEYESIGRQAGYANKTALLFDEIENKLCDMVRSGIGAGLSDTDKLLRLTKEYGLEKLYELYESFCKSAEGYRHSIEDKSISVLEKMAGVYAYISLARKRLALISALYNMRM